MTDADVRDTRGRGPARPAGLGDGPVQLPLPVLHAARAVRPRPRLPAAGPAAQPEEVARLVRAFARLGVRKVRLTGGEPLLRRDLEDLRRADRRHPRHRGRRPDHQRRPAGGAGRGAVPGRAAPRHGEPRQPRPGPVRRARRHQGAAVAGPRRHRGRPRGRPRAGQAQHRPAARPQRRRPARPRRVRPRARRRAAGHRVHGRRHHQRLATAAGRHRRGGARAGAGRAPAASRSTSRATARSPSAGATSTAGASSGWSRA